MAPARSWSLYYQTEYLLWNSKRVNVIKQKKCENAILASKVKKSVNKGSELWFSLM